jgi:hypothetical protein
MSHDEISDDELNSSQTINVINTSSNISNAEKMFDLSVSSINFALSDQINKNMNQKKRKFENKLDNSREMIRSQIVNHFQNAKSLLLKAALSSENSKIILVIKQIDQLIDSKNETTKKENFMLNLHRKVNRIDQLLERQNMKNEKNVRIAQKVREDKSNKIISIANSINQSKNVRSDKEINHKTFKEN